MNWRGFWLGLLGGFCLHSSAWALGSPCRRHFQQKQYAKAAQCFEGVVATIDKKPEYATVRTLLKDRYLRNASISYNRAANASTSLARRSFYKETAINILKRSAALGYCRASNRCQGDKVYINRLKQEIQYGFLTVATGTPNTRIVVKGFHYQKESRKNFNETLRPGLYTLTISLPGKPTRKQIVMLKPSHRALINVTPVKVRVVERRIYVAKKIPPLVLAGYITGSLVVGVGAGLLVYGVVTQGHLNIIRLDPNRNPSQRENDYHQGFEQAATFAVIGGVTMGAGALLLVGGVTAHLLANRATAKKPPLIQRSIQMGVFGHE